MFLVMRPASRLCLFVILGTILACPGASIFGQAATAPSFEVATIKPSDPNKPGGGSDLVPTSSRRTARQ